MLSEPHVLINLARSYLNGDRDSFSVKQERRAIQEVVRGLMADLGLGDTEVMLSALRDGLNEAGLSNAELATVIKFYDAVRERLNVRPQVGTLAGSGLVPSIINSLVMRRDLTGYGHTTVAEDKQLVQALLEDPRVRALLYGSGRTTERELIGRFIAYEDGFCDDDVAVLLDFYEDCTDPKALIRRQKRAELERLEGEVARLRGELMGELL